MQEAYQLEREGSSIHYWLAGPADAPLIIFTHGAQVDHHMFEAQVTALVDTYRILTWDMRGHGLSQPFQGELTYRSIADDILALLDAVNAPQAILIGHSMGGCASQEVVFSHPERVRGLILIGSPCVTESNPRGTKIYGRMLQLVGRILPEKACQGFMSGATRSFSLHPQVQDYIRSTTHLVPKAAFVAIGQAVITGYHAESDYHIQVPWLLTHGDQDIAAIRQQAPGWADREPNCRYVVIPQASHNANQDNEQFFNETMLSFLKTL